MAPQQTKIGNPPASSSLSSLSKVQKGPTTYSYRKRRSRKLREQNAFKQDWQLISNELEADANQQRIEQAQKDEASAKKEVDALTKDNARSAAEQLLLERTKGLPHACYLTSERLQEMSELFKRKDALLPTKAEQEGDDQARRRAVFDIMLAREKCQWERKGESLLWTATSHFKFDVQAAIVNKFNSKAQRELKDRLKDRNSQRALLQYSLALPNRGGIPKSAIPWLTEIINQTIVPTYSTDRVKPNNARLQAVYYIFVCRRDAGLAPLEYGGCRNDSGQVLEDLEGAKFHDYLMEQPRRFFRNDFPEYQTSCDIQIETAFMKEELKNLESNKGAIGHHQAKDEEKYEVMDCAGNDEGLSQPLAAMNVHNRGIVSQAAVVQRSRSPIQPEPVSDDGF